MKRMKTKFLISGLLTSALLLGACGADDAIENNTSTEDSQEVAKEGFPIVEEPIKMSLMAPGTGLAEWKDMPTLQQYEEMTNIEFEYSTPPLNDFETNLNLAFASGDLPDILFAPGTDSLTPAMEVDYGKQGLLLPLNDLIDDYAPNLSQLMEERPDIRKSITTSDGNIYALPGIVDGDTASWIRGPIWINGDWMDALDIEEVPSTIDELYDMLVRFRDEDPNGNGKADEIPLSDVKMDSTRPWLLAAFGMKEWGIEEVNDEVRYAPITDNYRGYLEFMNKLYEEELLDSEVFSQADEQKKAKGEENRLGMFPDWFSFFTTGQNEEDSIVNPMMGPLTSDYSEEPLFPINPGINRGTFAISTTNPNPAAAIRWVDYMYSEEGYEFFNRGPEGYLWEWEDEEEGIKRYNPDIKATTREEYKGEITPFYGISTPGHETAMDPIGGEKTEFEKFILKETEEKIIPYGEVSYPLVYLTPEEQEIVGEIEVDLETYVRNSEAQFITGELELTEEGWDNYISTIENMNLDEYIQVYQDAFDRWKSSN